MSPVGYTACFIRWVTALIILAVKDHSHEVAVTFNASEMHLQVVDDGDGILLNALLKAQYAPRLFTIVPTLRSY
ncbi:unnamed protein product [Soboliphyme baturini]|uniref:HATPase_c domain-containing protein n=1 Tax=Soboliphyme baturini TaxID=241478 RepID=A0A183I9W6_9BILA|nr:unnamed protein product [Soboliphyme baturini]